MANVRRVTSVTSFILIANKKGVLTDEGDTIARSGLGSLSIPADAEISLRRAEGGFELVVKYQPAEEVAAS